MTKLGLLRRLRLGSWRDLRSWRDRLPLLRDRLPLVLLVAAVVAIVAAASGVVAPTPGLRVAPGGHWVANSLLGMVFHINGAARQVDARAAVPGMEPGSEVVQGDTSGYVVSGSRIVEFGKSSLSVERTIIPPTGERPVAVEAAGGPYLVYREAGRVVRLGDPAASIPAGGVLGEPVATPDGTLWLHRVDSGVLCRLAAGTDRISCPAAAPAGHTGALTVVGDQPVFIDTAADTLNLVTDHGLTRTTPIGVDVPATARVAPVDVGGRVAIVDPAASRMHLLDTAGLDANREAAAPLTVALPEGAYSAPSATPSSVVLLDLKRNTLLTYNNKGQQQRTTPVPPEAGEPTLRRGEDKRVYVSGAEGRHVLVVNHDGAVGQVPVVGGKEPKPSVTPVPVVPTSPPPVAPTRSPRPVPASPPGMPANLSAGVQGADVRVTWGAAAANGATVSAYHITWAPVAGGAGGSATQPGNTRSMNITGLTAGVAYQISVVAQNSAGRGSPATARATVPRPAPRIVLSRGPTETYNSSCEAPECGLMHIEMYGFEPNTRYQIVAHSDDPGYTNSVRLTTDENGTQITDRFHFGQVGRYVWITVAGVESNRFRWVSG